MIVSPTASFTEIAKNIDDFVRSDFESFRDGWFHWLLFWTAIVAVGLLFELPEIIHDSVEAIRNLRHIPTPTSEIRPWMKLLVSVGWLLIVVGVMGEFVADSFVSNADGIVATFNENLLADAQRRTGIASERAASAFERATQTEREASQENERAAKALEAAEKARTEAEGFQLKIAQANERAAEANRTAESERLARLQLEKELQPRRLTGNQKEKLRSLVSGDPQQIMFGWCLTGSDDCQDLVNDIGDAFNKAGWKTVFGSSTRNRRGIQVGFVKGSDERLAAHWVAIIRNAISEVGLASEQTWFDPDDRTLVGGFQKNVLYVIVGQKPAIKTTDDNSQ